MMDLTVGMEFTAFAYDEIEPEIHRQAKAFFGHEDYELGWIDVKLSGSGAGFSVTGHAYPKVKGENPA